MAAVETDGRGPGQEDRLVDERSGDHTQLLPELARRRLGRIFVRVDVTTGW